MSDSASNNTEMPLPKLARSRITSAEKQPTLGDISALQSEIKSSKSNTQSVGDIQNVASASANDVLGDITLLEEAFAEMEVSVTDYEQEIPMLHSAIEQPSSISQVEVEAVEVSNQSIPVLDQPPTEFVEKPEAGVDSIHIGTDPGADFDPNIPTLEAASERAEEPAPETTINSVISAPENTPPVEESAVISTVDSAEADIDEHSAHHSLIESNSEPAANDSEKADEVALQSIASEPVSEPPELSVVQAEPSQVEVPENSVTQNDTPDVISEENSPALSELVEEDNESPLSQSLEFNSTQADDLHSSDSISIEEQIASATGDAEPSAPASTLDDIEEQPSTELAPSIIEEEEVVRPHANPPNDAASMSIPFELHAQLSKKIDALVLDATLSLTSELHNQLSLQLESLLCGAVEAVLPRLVDQMVNELRTEVKARVQQQLPIIVNEVLGKTRLS